MNKTWKIILIASSILAVLIGGFFGVRYVLSLRRAKQELEEKERTDESPSGTTTTPVIPPPPTNPTHKVGYLQKDGNLLAVHMFVPRPVFNFINPNQVIRITNTDFDGSYKVEKTWKDAEGLLGAIYIKATTKQPYGTDNTIRAYQGIGIIEVLSADEAVSTPITEPAPSVITGAHQTKKTLKQYLKDTYGTGWRSRWNNEKEKMKNFSKSLGDTKAHWRRHANEYVSRYYPNLLGAGDDDSDFSGSFDPLMFTDFVGDLKSGSGNF